MTSAHISRRCKTIEFSQVYAHAHFNLYCSSIVCCLGAAEANYHQLTRTLQKLVLCCIDADFLRSCTHWNTFDEIFVQKYADVLSATNSNVAECLHSLRQNVSQILPDGRLAFRSKMLANFGGKMRGCAAGGLGKLRPQRLRGRRRRGLQPRSFRSVPGSGRRARKAVSSEVLILTMKKEDRESEGLRKRPPLLRRRRRLDLHSKFPIISYNSDHSENSESTKFSRILNFLRMKARRWPNKF